MFPFNVKYEITEKNVELYKINKHRLPCFANSCSVSPTCFKERQFTKNAKSLRYTVELNEPCVEAILIMDYIHFLPKFESNLEVPIEEMDAMGIGELFDKSLFRYENCQFDEDLDAMLPVYLMFIKVTEKDSSFVKNGKTAYLYLGEIWDNFFEANDFAKELYTTAIKLNPNDSHTHIKRGFCWLQDEDYGNALTDLKNANAIDGGCIPGVKEIIMDIENRQKGLEGDPKFDTLYS